LLSGGRLELQGVSLKDLITIAWDVDDDSVTGGPKWLDSDHFDVVAKAASPLPVFALVLGEHQPETQGGRWLGPLWMQGGCREWHESVHGPKHDHGATSRKTA
jgi:hypothetical protein